MLQEKSYQSTGTQRKVRKGLPETTIKNLKEELLGELKNEIWICRGEKTPGKRNKLPTNVQLVQYINLHISQLQRPVQTLWPVQMLQD